MDKYNIKGIKLLHKLGNGGIKMPHVEVWLGLVDIREVRSDKGGQRKRFYKKAVANIISDFDWVKFKIAGTCVMEDGTIHIGDGKHRTAAVRTLYRKGNLDTPWIPSYIFFNVTENDSKIMFAEQDDNHTNVSYSDKVDNLIDVEGENYNIVDTLLKECGFPKGLKSTNAFKTIIDCYLDLGKETFIRAFKCISVWNKWKIENVLSADNIKMLHMLYKIYSDKVEDTILVKQISSSNPSKLKKLGDKWKELEDDRDRCYLIPMVKLYNGNRTTNILELVA